MPKISERETLYRFFTEYQEKVRVKDSQLHILQDKYKNIASTKKLIEKARKKRIIMGPFIYCNSGIEVDLLTDVENEYYLFLKLRHDPSVASLWTFFGEHSLMVIRNGASTLKYAEAICPVYPSKFHVQHIKIEKEGKLPVDEYPKNWEDLDWEIYNLMRNPSVSLPKVAGRLDISWKTVKERFQKLLKDCKVWTEFFPNGKSSYSPIFLCFKTEYELGLREQLQKLDRTSIIYKVGETILLTLYLRNNLELYSFLRLKKEGSIHELKVSIPLRHWTKFRRVGPKVDHPRFPVDELLRNLQMASL